MIDFKLKNYNHNVNGDGDWDGYEKEETCKFQSLKEAYEYVDNQPYYGMHNEPFVVIDFFNPLLLIWQNIEKLTPELEARIKDYLAKLNDTRATSSTFKVHNLILKTLDINRSQYWADYKKKSLSMNEWLIYIFSGLNHNDIKFNVLKIKFRKLFKIAKVRIQNQRSFSIIERYTIDYNLPF